MGDLKTIRFARLPIVAGILAAVLLFLYGIAPFTHYRAHLSGDCTSSVSVAQHSEPATDAVTVAPAEDADNCALCLIQATQSVLAATVSTPTFVETPLPVYEARIVSQPVIFLFRARRGPPRAPPALV